MTLQRQQRVAIGAAIAVVVIALIADLVFDWIVPIALLVGLATAAAAGGAAWLVTRIPEEPNDAEARIAGAVEALGSPDGRVRVGAVRELERVPRLSPRHADQVADVLLEHIRDRTSATADKPPKERVDTDVQAAVDALLKLRHGVDLSRLYLAGVSLKGSNLDGANLSHADLSGADLRGANLQGAAVTGLKLAGAQVAGIKVDPSVEGSTLFDGTIGLKDGRKAAKAADLV